MFPFRNNGWGGGGGGVRGEGRGMFSDIAMRSPFGFCLFMSASAKAKTIFHVSMFTSGAAPPSRHVHFLCKMAASTCIFRRRCQMLLCIVAVCLLPGILHGHGHAHYDNDHHGHAHDEPASFKYSREANDPVCAADGHSHDHGHGHGHALMTIARS